MRADDTVAMALDAGVPAEAVVAVSDGEESGTGWLVVTRGPGVGSRITLNRPRLTAGRHPESDLFLDDVTVSRRHAEIISTDAGYEIVDVGSLNGTYVNLERVERTVLQTGDEVQIGKFKLVFESGAVTAP